MHGTSGVLICFAQMLALTAALSDLFLPNERTRLDDCQLRFPRMEGLSYAKPAFGHPARLKEFAHMGAIGWIQLDGSMKWNCGGTLIWYNYVLTAAHCVVDSNNRPPNVVRFGDLDLSTSEDDEYAQQLNIAEIIRHPQHRFTANYHDIALLRLERNITVTEVVVPACLWAYDEVRFRAMEATGWGATGFAEKPTPVLLKVTLRPMKNFECSEYYNNQTTRKLRFGLQNHQLCAVDEKMDTCEGDSGGPLQVKLLHNARVTPFVVAITSFGGTCGVSAPGVYTKIAPYYNWIIDTMQKRGEQVDESTFNATLCALRFASIREYEDGIITSRTKDYVSVDSSARLMVISHLPDNVVQLSWHPNDDINCYGIILDEFTVLTVASCATYNGKKPTHVKYQAGSGRVNVSSIDIHPNYSFNDSYYDVAIVHTSTEVFLDVKTIHPSCIHMETNMPYARMPLFGKGRNDLNAFIYNAEPGLVDPKPVILEPRMSVKDASSCKISEIHMNRIKYGLTREQICLGNDEFLVPESCDLLVGTPISDGHQHYPTAFALTQFGRDCGFGEHAITTNLGSHIEWLKSRLLPSYVDTRSALSFIDSDRREGDSCRSGVGKPGQCVPLSRCLYRTGNLLSSDSTKFCHTISVICCPLENIDKSSGTPIHPRLAECSAIVKRFNATEVEASMAVIGVAENDNFGVDCIGVILTKTTVLAAASCIGAIIPSHVGSFEGMQTLRVDRVVVHPDYNSTDGRNDAVLIKLKEEFQWNQFTAPGCIWMNTTHTPLLLEQYYLYDFNNNTAHSVFVSAMYNSDCQRFHGREVSKTQLCAKRIPLEETCGFHDSQLRWKDEEDISYIVALGSVLRDCGYYGLFARVSSFVDWISMNL